MNDEQGLWKYQESISEKRRTHNIFFYIQDNCGRRFLFTVALEKIFLPIVQVFFFCKLLWMFFVLPILRTIPPNKGKKSLQVKECPSNILSDVLNEILISYKAMAFSGRTSIHFFKFELRWIYNFAGQIIPLCSSILNAPINQIWALWKMICLGINFYFPKLVLMYHEHLLRARSVSIIPFIEGVGKQKIWLILANDKKLNVESDIGFQLRWCNQEKTFPIFIKWEEHTFMERNKYFYVKIGQNKQWMKSGTFWSS